MFVELINTLKYTCLIVWAIPKLHSFVTNNSFSNRVKQHQFACVTVICHIHMKLVPNIWVWEISNIFRNILEKFIRRISCTYFGDTLVTLARQFSQRHNGFSFCAILLGSFLPILVTRRLHPFASCPKKNQPQSVLIDSMEHTILHFCAWIIKKHTIL